MINQMENKLAFAIVSFHKIYIKGLGGLLKTFGHSVPLECSNGNELIELLATHDLPDMAVIDFENTWRDELINIAYLKQHYPSIKIISVYTEYDEAKTTELIHNGIHGYMSKAEDTHMIKIALQTIMQGAFYYPTISRDPFYPHPNRGLSKLEIRLMQIFSKLFS